MVVLVSSNVTTASFGSKVAATFSTPFTFCSAFLTVMGQAEQVMPGTRKVTVLLVASAGLAQPMALTMTPKTPIFHGCNIALSLVQQRHKVRKNERSEHKGCDHPEHALIQTMRVWKRTEGARLARFCCGCTINRAVRKHQTHEGDADEEGAVGFERREVPNPSTAHT